MIAGALCIKPCLLIMRSPKVVVTERITIVMVLWIMRILKSVLFAAGAEVIAPTVIFVWKISVRT